MTASTDPTSADAADAPSADDTSAAHGDTEGGQGGDRAERSATLRTLALIAAIAVVVAAATVVWARLSVRGTGTTTDVPGELADGSAPATVPAEVTRAIGVPIVGARSIDDLGAIAEPCSVDPAEVQAAFVTPDHAVLVARTATPPPGGDAFFDGVGKRGDVHVSCTAEWSGGTWRQTSLANAPVAVADMRAPGMADDIAVPSASTCCDRHGRMITHHVLPVPDAAAWLLEDHGAYAVAYDVRDSAATAVQSTATSNGTITHAWWLGGDGTIVGEVYLGG